MKDILRIGLLIAVVVLAVVAVWQGQRIAQIENAIAALQNDQQYAYIRDRTSLSAAEQMAQQMHLDIPALRQPIEAARP